MKHIEWDEQYEVGDEKLDQQHQLLVAIINRLGEAIESGNERPVLMKILSDLAGYTKTHFAAEELVMRQAGFSGIEEHRNQHANLNRQLADFYRNFYISSRPQAHEVMVFLQSWLYDHILEQDKQYVPFLAAIK
jgi:hemerythrin-like metal-binding protein